jgi:hypothetical protein
MSGVPALLERALELRGQPWSSVRRRRTGNEGGNGVAWE